MFSIFWRVLVITSLVLLVVLGVIYNQQIMAFAEETWVTHQANEAVEEGSYDKAIELYDQGLKAYPARLSFGLPLAALYVRQEKMSEAEGVYQKLLAQHPQSLEARVGYARLLMGEPGRMNDAVAQCRQALKAHHGDPQLLTTLGDLYKQGAENPEESRSLLKGWLLEWAVYYYRLSLQADPKQFLPRFNLGVVYQQLENPEKAAFHYCQAIQIAPKSYEAHYNFGLALVSFHAYEEAYRQFTQATQLLSEEGRAEEARALAEKIQGIKNSIFEYGEQNSFQKTAALPEGVEGSCLANQPGDKQ